MCEHWPSTNVETISCDEEERLYPIKYVGALFAGENEVKMVSRPRARR